MTWTGNRTPDRRPLRVIRLFNGQRPPVNNNEVGLRSDWWSDGEGYLLPEMRRLGTMGYRRIMISAPAGRLWWEAENKFDVYSSAQWETLPANLQTGVTLSVQGFKNEFENAAVYVYLGHRIAASNSLAMDSADPAAHAPDVTLQADLDILSANLDPFTSLGVDGFIFDNAGANVDEYITFAAWLTAQGIFTAGEAIPRNGDGTPYDTNQRWFARSDTSIASYSSDYFHQTDPPSWSWYTTEVISAQLADASGTAATRHAQGYILGSYRDDQDAEVLEAASGGHPVLPNQNPIVVKSAAGKLREWFADNTFFYGRRRRL